MNDYTARILRTELNRERFYLERGEREQTELTEKLDEVQARNTESRHRIEQLTETLEAAGASTEPWPDAFAKASA